MLFLFIASLQASLAAPPRKHKCPEGDRLKDRVIKEEGDIKVPKLLKYVPPQYPPAAQISAPIGLKVRFEILISETGEVECIELLAPKPGQFVDFVEEATRAVKQMVWEIPRNSSGQPVACYKSITVDFTLKR